MYAKKSLGQNFLNSKTVAHDIVRAAELVPTDTVLEIGPGKGFLTEELIASGAHVIAVEKDDRMIPLLSEKFADAINSKQFTLIHGDIVEILEKGTLKLPPAYKLVANIPYYLTGYLVRVFLEALSKPERMILMLQKEVADRIVARDKKESILSIAVKVYGTPHIVKKVPARYFTPAPKVDSAVLAIENISNKNFSDNESEKRFFNIVRTGFSHKRKKLAGNLRELFGDKTLSLLDQANVDLNVRAEDITLSDWLAIGNIL
ncbi:MAG: ribosomal RNA small subunit methyltransferase A [Candidatus Yonathbacteria bacterium RIFOXYC2_FULL_47_9]|nr:MAG: ribosomal RNA small subunit methyltransferase A [Candidatus Yonathbacteria bacterium RIFOXYC2_FULL_47_9]HAT68242.1 ribosomal RNA small subunit methyltransferase A [Candidatus Yonathbacteria bacterium]